MAFSPIIRKLPFIGNDIYKIGQVYDIVNTPCAIEPMLWVKAFWHEVPFIFWSLFKPDPIDFVQERFGRRHHRKRRHKMKAGYFQQADINPGKGLGWAAWKASQWLDRVGWYLLIADTSVQFALNWTTLTYQWAGCPVPGTPYINMSRDGGFIYPFSGVWRSIVVGVKAEHILTNIGDNAVYIPPDVAASVQVDFRLGPTSDFRARQFALRLINNNTGKTIFEDKSKEVGENEYGLSYSTPVLPKSDRSNAIFATVMMTDGFAGRSIRAQMDGYGGKPTDGLLFDP